MKQSKTNPTTTKRSSSADSKRANSPILSPVKEESSSELKFPYAEEDNTPEFSNVQQTFIQDLLEKQAHIFARQQDEDNRYREDQIDRIMAQMRAMNDRIEHGLAPQTPHTPTVPIQERILMETPKVQRPHDIAYHDLMASSSKAPVPPTTPANTTTPHTLEESMEKLLTSMGSFLTHSKKDDNTTELPKFHGGDAQWPQWYQSYDHTCKPKAGSARSIMSQDLASSLIPHPISILTKTPRFTKNSTPNATKGPRAHTYVWLRNSMATDR
jgi:hypothetical protein